MSDYARGYLDGYRDVLAEQRTDAATIGEQEAERQTFAEGMGEGQAGQELSDYWLGYYHGRAHRQHGQPPEGARARGQVPAGL